MPGAAARLSTVGSSRAGGRRGPPAGARRGTAGEGDMTTGTEDARGAGGGQPRRRFLTGALAAGAMVPLVGWGRPGCAPRPPTPPAGLPDGLFALGVASGDPLHDAVVIWTRLAPAPLEGGGMPAVDVPVRWEVAADEGFRHDVRRGDAVPSPQWAHSVHVDVRHLRPGAWYFYRFIVGDQVSTVGRTRTAPSPGHRRDPLRFLFGSCQN